MNDAENGQAARPLINIEGTLIALGPMRKDLLLVYQRWMNDFRTVRNLSGSPRPLTFEQEEGWFADSAARESTIDFTVYEKNSWQPVGNTGLMAINDRDRTAVFGILIGEPAMRGKGYGAETARLMLDYAFTALGLHSVSLTVNAENRAGRRAYEKAGFREFGRQRQNKMVAGAFQDTIHMDCLASEFTSPVLADLLAPDDPR
ncbi:MAG TPA: GNAT family protein [Chloroflexota bacterium]|nr:GNAT family protein [Chloroflexota bacterium]